MDSRTFIPWNRSDFKAFETLIARSRERYYLGAARESTFNFCYVFLFPRSDPRSRITRLWNFLSACGQVEPSSTRISRNRCLEIVLLRGRNTNGADFGFDSRASKETRAAISLRKTLRCNVLPWIFPNRGVNAVSGNLRRPLFTYFLDWGERKISKKIGKASVR